MKSPTGTFRLISAALLLFVFFLPFHLHFSVKAQVGKECSCVHGTRLQLAPAVNTAIGTPVFHEEVRVIPDAPGRFAEWFDLRDARAPPSALSA